MIYQQEELLQKVESLENKIIIYEEEIVAIKSDNEKMLNEAQKREKIIEEVIALFESEILEINEIKKSQEKTRYMNYKDNFEKLKIVSEKIAECFLNKESNGDFSKKQVLREYKNSIKMLFKT